MFTRRPAAVAEKTAQENQKSWTRHHPFTVGFFLTLGGLVAIGLAAALSSLSTVLIYIGFALFAALGLDPLVRYLVERGVKRAWAIVAVCVAFAAVITGVLLLIVPTVVDQITQFVGNVPTLIADFQKSDLYSWLSSTFGENISDLANQVASFFSDPGNLANIGGGVLAVGATVAEGISGGVIIIVLTLYFLASMPAIKRAFVRLMPARNRPKVADLTEQITESIGGYLVGMVILAAMNAVVALALYFFLGLPFPALMAVIAFFITLIPLVGSVIFLGLATALALFVGPVPALIFAGVYLAYMQLEAYVLTPRVMNRAISIPGSLVVIGALVGGTLLGLLGALIAIPVTASFLLIYKQVIQPRQDAKV